MDAKAKSLQDILFSDIQFLVPFFQRDYAWSQANWDRLRHDIWQLLDDSSKRKHFLGPLVCSPLQPIPGESARFQLIDGQQRITTLSIMLLALRDVASEAQDEELSAEINECYLIHRFKKGHNRYKLLPRSGDRETFQAIVDKKTDKIDKSRNIYCAYSYFYKLIRNHARTGDISLRELFGLVVSRLFLVVISLGEEDPYEIFESLNSTGLPLQESDLIRNFLFMQIPIDDQDVFQEDCWLPFEDQFDPDQDGIAIKPTHFYRDFLRRNGKYVSAKSTFSEFKSHYEEQGYNPTSAVVELTEFLSYERMVQSGKHADKGVVNQLKQFGFLDTAVATPVILNLLHRHAHGALTSNELAGCINSINSFILRRSICGETTRGYGTWFCDLIEQLGDQPVVQLNSYLLHRGWPDDDAFERALVEFPIYARENLKCRLILQELEKAYAHKEIVDLSTLQIEHVMPQTLQKSTGEHCWYKMLGANAKAVHKRYLHTLGNLTLTGYNPKLSNRPFREKVEELKLSNLSINREIVKVPKWDEERITSRTSELSKRIVKIWPRPTTDVPYVPIKVARDEVFKAGRQRRAEYWNRLTQMLKDSQCSLLPVRPSDGTYVELYMPVCDVQMFVQYLRPKSRMVVQLKFFRERGKQIFRAFQQERQLLEREANLSLSWSDGNQPTISCALDNCSIKDPLDWLEQHEWITSTVQRFHDTFYDRVTRLHNAIKEKSETRQILLDFWLGFHHYLYEHGNTMPHNAAQSFTNNDFTTGRSAFWYSAIVNPSSRRLTVALMLGTSVSRAAWPQLISERDAIENHMGVALEWNCPADQKIWAIRFTRNESPVNDREHWPECFSWLFNTLKQFDETFRQRIARLDIDGETEDEHLDD